MTLLNSVRVSFILEGPNMIGPAAVNHALECDRISCEGLIQTIRILCGSVTLQAAAAGPVQIPQKPDPVPSEKSAADKTKKQKVKKIQEHPGKSMPCPYCDRTMDTRTLHHHVRKKHPEKYNKDVMTEWIRGTSSPPSDHRPAEGPSYKEIIKNSVRPPHEPRIKDPDGGLDTVSPFRIVTGMKVRQVKPDQGKMFQGVGTVTARVGGLLEVDLGNGMRKKIDAACLGAA